MKENIENVSKELEEMKTSKKKNENINIAYNLKSYINVNNKNFTDIWYFIQKTFYC